MARPYATTARGFEVAKREGGTVVRPNRTAAGMTYTKGRSKTRPPSLIDAVMGRYIFGVPRNGEALLSLLVWGTSDEMRGLMFRASASVCSCCGAKTGKLKLNERGKLRLRVMRRRTENRLAREVA